ncbi:MAG: hypothetical protein WD096_07965 [Actinomycetota bacterium]
MEREEPKEERERSAARQAAEEPEPDWAEKIRALRKARAARLKDVYSSFEDDGGGEQT